MTTDRIAGKTNTTQFNAEVNATIKKEFDIALIRNDDKRAEVVNHLLKWYAENGLPRLEP